MQLKGRLLSPDQRMKRQFTIYISVLAVAAVLSGGFYAYYDLQKKVSEASRERMQRRVASETTRFAEDFNREIQAAYFNFPTDRRSWEQQDWSEFNARYDHWRAQAAHPGLIRDFIFFQKQSEAGMLRYDSEARRFAEVEPDEDLRWLRSRIENSPEDARIFEDVFALVLPVFAQPVRSETLVFKSDANTSSVKLKTPERYGSLVVRLDEKVIREQVFPELVNKYFPEGDFHLSVSGAEDRVIFRTGSERVTPDFSASLLDLAPDNFVFFSNRELMPMAVRQVRPGMVVDHHIETRSFTRTSTGPEGMQSGSVKIEVQDGSRPGTSVFSTSIGSPKPWKLEVQHTAGSIDQFVRSERDQGLFIGAVVYLSLLGGIMAIIFSSVRAQRFAQRQIEFVSSVSHEFRTPLAVIYSAGENLADGVAKDRDQITRYGDLIKNEGRKLSGMVEQILEFAGARSGQRKFAFAPADLSAIAKEAVEQCSALLEDEGFQVETDLPDDLPQIRADADALSSAIQNLIRNAIKYSNGNRWIRVAVKNGSTTIKLQVEDKGIGISKSEIGQIFEPFYRSKAVVDSQIHGSGLGLALVRQIAEAHGGRVTAESEPGAGSLFTIEIPHNGEPGGDLAVG